MDNNLLFWPALAQVALTLFMFLRLASVKAVAAKAGQVDEKRRALHPDAWPDRVLQVTNNIRNQFEMPVLFFVLIGILWATHSANWITMGLAWAYVAARIVHAAIHVGSNIVQRRLAVFKLSTLLLIALMLMAVAGVAGLN